MIVGIIVVAVMVWLFMARMCYRWSCELERGDGFDALFGSLFFWWLAIPCFLPFYLIQRGRGRTLSPRGKWMGESDWHRSEREAKQHEARAKELGVNT